MQKQRVIRPGQPRTLPSQHEPMEDLYAQGHSLQTELDEWEAEEQAMPRDYPHASPGALLHAVLSRQFAPLNSPTPDSMMRDVISPAGDVRRTSGMPQLKVPELPTPPSEGFAGAPVGAPATSRTQRDKAMQSTVRSSFSQPSKARRDLSPIKQRAMTFRAGINKNTVNAMPGFCPSSVMESALEYSMPDAAPESRLDASLLDEFRGRARSSRTVHKELLDSRLSVNVSGGSFTLPAFTSKSLFTNSQRLPFHTASAGLLATSLGGKSVTAEKSVTDLLQLLAPHQSMAEAYTFDVPASVRTGLDAVTLFASSAAKEGLIVFCNLNPASKEYNPYDLVVVNRENVDPSFFYIITQMGVTHMWSGVAHELIPHHEWIRNAELFAILKKLVFFKKQHLFLAFRKWHTAVRAIRFSRRQHLLTSSLLHLSPIYGPALLAIRRMTLSMCEDPSGAWRRVALPGNRCTWISSDPRRTHSRTLHHTSSSSSSSSTVQQQLQQRAHGTPPQGSGVTAEDAANLGLQEKAREGSGEDVGDGTPVRVSGTPPPQAGSRVGTASGSSKPGTGDGRSVHEDGATREQPDAASASAARGLEGDDGGGGLQLSGSGQSKDAGLPHGDLEREQSCAASRAATECDNQSVSKAPEPEPVPLPMPPPQYSPPQSPSTLPPHLSLLGPCEHLPEGGLPAQLGHVGGAQDLFALPDFKHMRSEIKDAVHEPVTQMLYFMVQRVHEVGDTVQASLQKASAALARPTIQEARAKKFEFIPSKERWRHHSQHLAKEAVAARVHSLAAAQGDCSKFGVFVALADALLLSQAVELARLATSVASHQVFLARRQGLFVVTGRVQNKDPESCPRSRHILAHTTSNNPGGKQATQNPAWPRELDKESSSMIVPQHSVKERHTPPANSLTSKQQRPPYRSSMKGGGNAHEAAAAAAEAAVTDTQMSMEGALLPVVFVPAIEELVGALEEVVRDILFVAAHAACGLRNHAGVRTLQRTLRTKASAASADLSALGWRPALMREGQLLSSSSVVSEGQRPQHHMQQGAGEEDLKAAAGQQLKGGSVLDLLRHMVKAESLSACLATRVRDNYSFVLASPVLQPYVGHAEEWDLVENLRVCASVQDQVALILDTPVKELQRPYKLVSELGATYDWVMGLANYQHTHVRGLLHFDLTNCRADLLQRTAHAYQGLLGTLSAYLLVMLRDMLSRLQRYINRLVKRPTVLPEFVSWMELVWNHLDDTSSKRQQIAIVHEQLGLLHKRLMAAIPPAPSSATDEPAPAQSPTEQLMPDRCYVPIKDARPVHLIWKQIEVLMGKYLEEAAGAASFASISSPMMATHLKHSLLQMESDLLELLRDMRTGMMTSTSAPRVHMGAALYNKEQLLQDLSKQHAQCAAWAKLLTQGGVEQTMAQVRKLMAAATHVLAARTRLWHVLGEWGELMDTMYATPCFGEGVHVRSLVERLEMDLEELAEEVEGITSLHTADDISSIETVTPEEANLGAHYSVVDVEEHVLEACVEAQDVEEQGRAPNRKLKRESSLTFLASAAGMALAAMRGQDLGSPPPAPLS